MVQQVSRRVEMGFPHELYAVTAYFLSIPRQVLYDVDAHVVFPGLGEWERIEAAIQLWQDPNSVARFLLIEGHNTTLESTSRVLTLEVLQKEFGLTKTDGVHITVHADHTGSQAIHVAQMMQTLGITSLALHVPTYHAIRACLTLLQRFRDAGLPFIPLIPAPTPCGPSRVVPEYADDIVTAWEMTGGEYERIQKYAAQGQLLSPHEALLYLRWLYEDPMINRYLIR